MEKLTIVIPNRNRDLKIVKQSLKSIHPQLIDHVTVTLVDYGSALSYQRQLKELIDGFKGIELITCPVQGQLWNKSRCINLILKNTTATHLMVSDMDLIWHPDFLETMMPQLDNKSTSYFPVGFMSQEESVKDVSFDQRTIKFMSNEEATGISIFPVHQLLEINGFDEFYHGWGGSEDTDVHLRLRNAGYEVRFRENEIYFKHQWHEKAYRSLNQGSIFHTQLEKINHQRTEIVKKHKLVQSNLHHSFGLMPVEQDYGRLETTEELISVNFEMNNVIATLASLPYIGLNKVIEIRFIKEEFSWSAKIKNYLKPKQYFLDAAVVNDMILLEIVNRYRNLPYFYSYSKESISLKIMLCE
ncbi:putative two-domain glycosyltransferase [Nonlabens ulvanivorans]|uniref:Putative two-domain glycosyltransferase n=1 Tax=Nonlabens ulvanivorans TaxID=906888 RepID=A0A090WDB5_NONUL|nr:galactosyltransferase-related protein [Nonlabens ulvanivorans]GAL74980.1 putative two-domain glycosyltransferase [Nonlabens ulvanivorans]